MLEGVNVALGVTGSIAAVKTVELAHELRRQGAEVRGVMGRLLVGAIGQRDFPTVQATVLVIAVSVVVANLLVDIAYAVLDPRIRDER